MGQAAISTNPTQCVHTEAPTGALTQLYCNPHTTTTVPPPPVRDPHSGALWTDLISLRGV